jgi:hypothetical protein
LIDETARALLDRVTRVPDCGLEVHPGITPAQRASARDVFDAFVTDENPPLVVGEDFVDDETSETRFVVTHDAICWCNSDDEPAALAFSQIDPRDVHVYTEDEDDEDSAEILVLGDDAEVVFHCYALWLDGLAYLVRMQAAIAHGEDPAPYLRDDDDDDEEPT